MVSTALACKGRLYKGCFAPRLAGAILLFTFVARCSTAEATKDTPDSPLRLRSTFQDEIESTSTTGGSYSSEQLALSYRYGSSNPANAWTFPLQMNADWIQAARTQFARMTLSGSVVYRLPASFDFDSLACIPQPFRAWIPRSELPPECAAAGAKPNGEDPAIVRYIEGVTVSGLVAIIVLSVFLIVLVLLMLCLFTCKCCRSCACCVSKLDQATYTKAKASYDRFGMPFGTCLCARIHVIATLTMLGCLLGLFVAPLVVASSMMGTAADDVQSVGTWLHTTGMKLNATQQDTAQASVLSETLVTALVNDNQPDLALAVSVAHLILEQTSENLSNLANTSITSEPFSTTSSDLQQGSLWMLLGAVVISVFLLITILPMALAPLSCWSCSCCRCLYRCTACCSVMVVLPLLIFIFPMLQAASLVMSDACHSPGFSVLAVASSYGSTGVDFDRPYPTPQPSMVLSLDAVSPSAYTPEAHLSADTAIGRPDEDQHSPGQITGTMSTNTPAPMAIVTTNTLAYYIAPAELVYRLLPPNPLNRTRQAQSTCDGWLDGSRGNNGPYSSNDDRGDGIGTVDDDLYSSRDDDIPYLSPEPSPPPASLPGRYKQTERLLGNAYQIIDGVFKQLLLASKDTSNGHQSAPSLTSDPGSIAPLVGLTFEATASPMAIANHTVSSIQQLLAQMSADYTSNLGCKPVRSAAVQALSAVCGVGVGQLLVPLAFCSLGVIVCLVIIALAWIPLSLLLPTEAIKAHKDAIETGRIRDPLWEIGILPVNPAATPRAARDGDGDGGGLLLTSALLAHRQDDDAGSPSAAPHAGGGGGDDGIATRYSGASNYGAINGGSGASGSGQSLPGASTEAHSQSPRDAGAGAGAFSLGGPTPPPSIRAWSLGSVAAAGGGGGGSSRMAGSMKSNDVDDDGDAFVRIQHAATAPHQAPAAPAYVPPPMAYGGYGGIPLAAPAAAGGYGGGGIRASASYGSQGGPDTFASASPASHTAAVPPPPPPAAAAAAGSGVDGDIWSRGSGRAVSGHDDRSNDMFVPSAMADVEAALGRGNPTIYEEDIGGDDDEDDDEEAAAAAVAAAAARDVAIQPPAAAGHGHIDPARPSGQSDERLLLLESLPAPPPPDDPYPEHLENEQLLEL